MGLDQYAEARKGEPTINEDGDKEWADYYELAYWRKHPNLQGFMEEKWCGEGEFNCADLELTLEDIDELEEINLLCPKYNKLVVKKLKFLLDIDDMYGILKNINNKVKSTKEILR